MVNASCGLAVPASDTADMSSAAVRGGLATTVGITSAGAMRCESVTDPSELFHMMTIGVFAICVPKPLCAGAGAVSDRRRGMRASQERHAHRHPPERGLALALEGVCRVGR